MLNIRTFSLYRSTFLARIFSFIGNIYFNFRDYKLQFLLPFWRFIYMRNCLYWSILDKKVYPPVKAYDRDFGEIELHVEIIMHHQSVKNWNNGDAMWNGTLTKKLINMSNLYGMLTLDVVRMVCPVGTKLFGIVYGHNRQALYIDLVDEVMSDTIDFEEKMPIIGGMLTFQDSS